MPQSRQTFRAWHRLRRDRGAPVALSPCPRRPAAEARHRAAGLDRQRNPVAARTARRDAGCRRQPRPVQGHGGAVVGADALRQLQRRSRARAGPVARPRSGVALVRRLRGDAPRSPPGRGTPRARPRHRRSARPLAGRPCRRCRETGAAGGDRGRQPCRPGQVARSRRRRDAGFPARRRHRSRRRPPRARRPDRPRHGGAAPCAQCHGRHRKQGRRRGQSRPPAAGGGRRDAGARPAGRPVGPAPRGARGGQIADAGFRRDPPRGAARRGAGRLAAGRRRRRAGDRRRHHAARCLLRRVGLPARVMAARLVPPL
jgi:hypothetical protein